MEKPQEVQPLVVDPEDHEAIAAFIKEHSPAQANDVVPLAHFDDADSSDREFVEKISEKELAAWVAELEDQEAD